jgi:putative addiction module killer protein
MNSFELRVCQNANGKVPFALWFHRLDPAVRFKISAALFQMEEGSFSDSKYLGRGIWERRVHSGPGYRIYFAKENVSVVIILCGGTKRRQHLDIRRAQELWKDYKHRRKSE